MAIEKIINVKVAGTNEIVQIQQAVDKTNQSTDKLTKSNKDLDNVIVKTYSNYGKKTKDLESAIDSFIKKQDEEIENTKDLIAVKKESAEVDAGTLDLMSKLDGATGGYIGKFQELQGGLKAGIGLFKSLKIAIAGTGIGLLVIAIGSLVAYFNESAEGGKKLANIMSYVGVITKSLTDGFAKLGELIAWVFENPKEAIAEMGTAIKENIANRITGLLQLIPRLGEAMSLVFKGEFKEAGKVAVNALAQVVTGQEDIIGKFGEMAEAGRKWAEEMQRQANEVQRIAQLRADALKIENGLIVETAKSNRQLSELRDKANNSDLYNSKQRQKYLREANALEQKITNEQLKSAQLKLQAIQAEDKLNKVAREDSKEQLEAEAQVINLLGQREQANRNLSNSLYSIRKADAEKYKSLREAEQAKIKEEKDKEIAERQKQLDSLLSIEQNAIKAREDLLAKTDQQRLDLEKERQLKALEEIKLNEEEKRNALIEINELFDLKQKEIDDAKEKEAEEKAIEDKYKMLEELQLTEEQRLQIISDIDDLILESNQLTEKERTALYDKQAKARIKIAEKEAENKSKLNSAIAQGAEALSGIIGKQTAIGKTLAVASSLINTYASIAGQLKAFSSIPVPGFAIAQAIATGLVGFASVKDILSVKVPESGGADAGAGGVAPSAPAVNLVGSTDSNQIAETINSQTDQQNENANKPMRAYVVTKDISTQEELERNASDSSSF